MDSIFTNNSITDGKVGIGKLPFYLLPILDSTAREYVTYIPYLNLTTYHTYYGNLSPFLKSNIERIQQDGLFKKICESSNCILKNIPEMNELYYSNPKPNFLSSNLYGAAANLIPHRDCVLFQFAGIQVYRMIIGLTDYNNDTITELIYFGIEHKINRGDYMIFDFDKTMHQVRKIGFSETKRILLKLHYIVCENCIYSERYIDIVSRFYKLYYIIARYTEQIGTDPTTFMGFFYGLLWEYPFYPEFRMWIYTLFFLNFGYYIFLDNIYEKRKSLKSIGKIGGYSIFYSLRNIFLLYLNIVAFYNIRWILIGFR
jgi:hypothetical protein